MKFKLMIGGREFRMPRFRAPARKMLPAPETAEGNPRVAEAGERYERWEPIEGITPKMALDAMLDGREGFRLILKEAASLRELRVLFDAPLCYRGTPEKHLLASIYQRHNSYPWPFFIVRNSHYANWFYAQAAEASNREGHHYHIAAIDRMVDVLSVRPPILTWLG